MRIQTAVFGELEICQDRIIFFKEGLPGFEELKRFVLIILEQTRPFLWLQAIDRDVAIPVISPFEIFPHYAPVIKDDIFNEIGLQKQEDLLVLVVVVIPPEVNLMTANMAAPILINIANNQGRQALAEDSAYQIRQPIFEAVCQNLIKEERHAGSDAKE